MTTEYTPNFRLSLPDFRMGPWHDLVNDDFVLIDSLIMGLYQGVDTQPWANNVHFKSGDTAVDQTDGTFWVCITEHTSAPTGTFAADRAAHPTYWNRVVVGIAPRGAWAHNTHYLPNDMVSDATQHVIAVCKTEHTSNASGTIRDDAAYWTFIADMGTTAINALQVAYDNTASGTIKTDLQGTTDELYSRLAAQVAQIAANTLNISTNSTNIANNTTSIGNLATRVTNTETVNTNQDTAIAGKLSDAPSDGQTYGRKNAAWVVGGGGGASVLVSDTPPVGPVDNSLWWESDTGNLYIRFNDGNSAQWVLVTPAMSAAAISAVTFTAQTLSAAQQLQARSNIGAVAPAKGYLYGLTLSTAGSSATFGLATGEATDSAGLGVMALTSAYTKTTGAWAVGTGNGALDTGAIANTTWYFPYLIKRLDTGVVDLLISLSPTAPALPSGYTLFRRIGCIRTNASGQWSKFSQREDTFLWDADDAGNAPFVNGVVGVTTAVTRGCTAPIGIQVDAILRVNISGNAASNCLFSSLDRSDEAATAVLNLCIPTGTSLAAQAELTVRTNTSAQFRTRLSNTATNLYYSTAGWIDTRGKLS